MIPVKEELQEVRARTKLLEAKMRLQALERLEQRQRRLTESAAAWEWIDSYNDVVDRLRGPERDLVLPVSTVADRRYGANWPFWRTLLEHSRLRASARLLHGLSNLAQGALNALTSYTVGNGYTVEVSTQEETQGDANKPLIAAVREAIKDFESANSWGMLQQELFLRSRRDGEYFLRAFDPGDGMLHVRTVSPEQVGEPPGYDPQEWSFGIHTDIEDAQNVKGFWVALDGNWGNGEEVDAEDMLHVKVNVDLEVKRGLTDFCFDTYDTLKSGQRLVESLAEGSAIQASIALLRQHDQSSATQVSEFVRGLADYTEPVGGGTSGVERNVQRFTPGTIVDAPKGYNFVVPPFASNAQGFVAVVQAVLRSVAVKWNAPEWIISGDASNNNYASSITAESPFVRSCHRWQSFYGAGFERIIWRAIRARCEAGRLRAGGRAWSYEEIRRAVALELRPPTLETRNRQEEASVNTAYLGAGVKSPQTICAELGLDYQQESANLAEHQEKLSQQGQQFGGGGGGLGGLMGGGGGGDDEEDPFGDEGGDLLAPLQEAGFTGRRQDKRGATICYDSGRRTSCGNLKAQGKDKASVVSSGNLRQILADPANVPPRKLQSTLRQLNKLTAQELKQLSREHGFRSLGGSKQDLARKIVTEASRTLTERQQWERKARAAGVRPDEMTAIARQERESHQRFGGEVKELLKKARQSWRNTTGKPLTRAHPAFRGGDPAGLGPQWELVARALARNYPDLLGSPEDSTENARRLYDLVLAGAPPVPPWSEMYEGAIDALRGSGGDPYSRRRKQTNSTDEVPF